MTRIFIRFILLFITYSFTFCYQSKSQLLSNRNNLSQANAGPGTNVDSIRKKQVKTNDSLQIYWFTWKDSSRQKIDSSISLLHRNLLNSIWANDLGNFASSSQSLVFDPSWHPQNRLGIFSNQLFLYDNRQLFFFNTTKPYTDLYFRFGSKQEQIIEIAHSRNIDERWNISASYRKEGSPGNYKLQRTNNDHLSLRSHFRSRNLRYSSGTSFLYNKIQQDENGGITSEEFLKYSNYNNKRLVPVNLDANPAENNRSYMINYYRDLSFRFDHQYFLGPIDTLYNADSSATQLNLKAVVGFKHGFYYNSYYHRFKDLSADSSFYNPIGSFSFEGSDSVKGTYTLNRIGNTFAIAGKMRLRQQLVEAEAGYGLEIDSRLNGTSAERFLNNFIFGSIDNASQHNLWTYDASIKFYFTGNLLGNLHLRASAGREFKQPSLLLKASFDQLIQASPLLWDDYETNVYSLSANTKKQTITRLGLSVESETLKASAKANYFMMANYLYRDTTLKTLQYAQLIPLIQVNVIKSLRWKSYVWANEAWIQYVSDQTPLHLPVLALSSRLALERMILKKKLRISTGFDTRYNTAFYADAYSPLLYSFVTQYNRRISNAPRVSYFFNFKVKSYRASISFDELQQLFTTNYINYAGYPSQNFMMRFGFHWTFVN